MAWNLSQPRISMQLINIKYIPVMCFASTMIEFDKLSRRAHNVLNTTWVFRRKVDIWFICNFPNLENNFILWLCLSSHLKQQYANNKIPQIWTFLFLSDTIHNYCFNSLNSNTRSISQRRNQGHDLAVFSV